MLRGKRDDGFRFGLFTGESTNMPILLTWSMMLVSAENLLRICPRGVISKNLSREEIHLKIPNTHFGCFFSALAFKGYVSQRRKSRKSRLRDL